MPLTIHIGGAMEYSLGMVSARPEREGYLARGSEPSPRLLQGLRDIVTSPGLGRGPTKFFSVVHFWDLNLAPETV